ncbi:MAG TPA: carbohydrate kinase family protein [Terriglobales bacterium]|nr:carbohydrate kinase family protein [Terriglobales bacterium]
MPENERQGREEIIVAGHICLDIIPQMHPSDLKFRPGTLEMVGPAVVSLGGCVPNTGLALKKLGAAVHLAGKIGTDPIGDLLQLELRNFGEAGNGLTRSSQENTSYSVILSPPGYDRMIFHFPGANDSFTAEDLASALSRPAEIFHFGYPPLMRKMFENDGRELEEIFRQARKKGLLTSLDMAYPDPKSPAGCVNWRVILARVLPHVDIFLPSYEELACMLEPETSSGLVSDGSCSLAQVDTKDLQRLGETACSMGAAVVGIKLGNRGLYVQTSNQARLSHADHRLLSENWANRELWTSVFKVNLVGTTGAGDATVAGFLYGILRGLPPEQVCRLACAVGACSVESADAVSGILPFDLVERRMREGWEQQAGPAAEGWPTVAPGVFAGTHDRKLRNR